MDIQAKMVCESVKPEGGEQNKYAETVTLRAVYSDGEENKSYSKATPNAQVTMTISNESAWGAFTVDKEYYLKFSPAN